ncbi:MAG TPA: hypothetical protein GXX75_08930 [Clostridiales bacterium]|nr:hypothetical protein [Clostridiales bacterium]
MIFYFKKSRNAAIIWSILLTVIGYMILPLLINNNAIPQLAYILVPVIAVYIALYIGKVVSYRKYQEVLLLLYGSLEVGKFILEGEKMLQARISKKEKCLLALHLSNGYLAAGAFDKAKDILNQNMPLAKRFGSSMEFSSNLIAALIQNNEIKAASGAISDLKQTVSTEKNKDRKLRLQKTLAYQLACLETAKGSNGYLDVLEKDYLSSKSILHKINVSRYLVELYQRTGKKEKGKQLIDYVLEHGNQHFLVKNIGV